MDDARARQHTTRIAVVTRRRCVAGTVQRWFGYGADGRGSLHQILARHRRSRRRSDSGS